MVINKNIVMKKNKAIKKNIATKQCFVDIVFFLRWLQA